MKIDFVVLWVDGSDPDWQRERDKFYGGEINQNKESAYRDWGTLRFWFRGVEKFSPWVNKIHFVTYGHLPKWLNLSNPKLHIVNHSDFISDEYLPTFSANSIELNIHKIHGLTEQFVYFNDDTFLISPVKENDFFVHGLPCDSAILSSTIPSVKNEIFTYILFNDLLLVNSNYNRNELHLSISKWLNLKYGRQIMKNLYYMPMRKFPGFTNFHLPNSYLKNTFIDVWNKEKDVLEQTVSKRFRTKEDVNQYVFRYWQLVNGDFYPRSMSFGRCFTIGTDDKLIECAIKNQKYKTICINDDPSEQIDFDVEKQRLFSWFNVILQEKSTFEL